uniref:glycosyltransferase family 2 protein n=1 Tax=Marinobacterium profundum TaxID=1714300 RepID=UPI0008366DA3|nr:glycosyltransferase family A protein [Marinobacterium profundum]
MMPKDSMYDPVKLPREAPMSSERLSVSVVIPCFNAAKYIAETLDSLLRQIVVPDEIIVVDDGSGDDSAAIAGAYGPPVRVVEQSNEGAAVARYQGALNAQMDLILFVDAGDFCPPHKVQTLRDTLIAHPQCICAFAESWNRAKPQPKLARFSGEPLDGKCTVVDDPFRVLLKQTYPLASAMNIAVRREFAVLGSNVGACFKAGNDHALQLNLARFGPFVHVALITQEFDILPGGLSTTYGGKLQMTYSLLAANKIYGEMSPKDKQKYEQDYRRKVSRYWPMVVGYLWKRSRRTLLKKVLAIAFRDGYWLESAKSVYWNFKRPLKAQSRWFYYD